MRKVSLLPDACSFCSVIVAALAFRIIQRMLESPIQAHLKHQGACVCPPKIFLDILYSFTAPSKDIMNSGLYRLCSWWQKCSFLFQSILTKSLWSRRNQDPPLWFLASLIKEFKDRLKWKHGEFYYSFKGKPWGRQAVKQQLPDGNKWRREGRKAVPCKLVWQPDTK